MPRPDLIIRGQRVVLPETIAPRSVHIREERIVFVGDYDDVSEGCEVVDAGESVVMPGLVDTHVHINAPGRTEWEGFVVRRLLQQRVVLRLLSICRSILC